MEVKRRRGRPFGYRLSEISKERIRRGRYGTHHRQETKDKISRSLTIYFKNKDSLAASLEDEYSNLSEEAADWIDLNRLDIDLSESIMTDRHLQYLKQLEISMGNELEQLFGHSATPEFFLLLKEELASIDEESIQELVSLI